jgi:hypothetical protein
MVPPMSARRRTSQLSGNKAKAALAQLLAGCTKERLAGFTAASLSASYNVPHDKAEELLARARQGRLL